MRIGIPLHAGYIPHVGKSIVHNPLEYINFVVVKWYKSVVNGKG